MAAKKRKKVVHRRKKGPRVATIHSEIRNAIATLANVIPFIADKDISAGRVRPIRRKSKANY